MILMEIFQRWPTKRWKVHQLRTILEYSDISISSAAIRDRLRILSSLSVILREGGSRVDSYHVNVLSEVAHKYNMLPAAHHLSYARSHDASRNTGT